MLGFFFLFVTFIWALEPYLALAADASHLGDFATSGAMNIITKRRDKDSSLTLMGGSYNRSLANRDKGRAYQERWLGLRRRGPQSR